MMKIIIKILSITLVAFLFNPHLFADIHEVNNNKIIILMESGVPLIDIRTKREWYETGVIKKSNLLTFFDKDGNYDVKEWMSKLKKIASNKDPVIIILLLLTSCISANSCELNKKATKVIERIFIFII